MPNLPKMATNESGRAREKHKDEQDKTKLTKIKQKSNKNHNWHRDWTIAIFGWLIMSYFGSFCEYFYQNGQVGSGVFL